MAVKALTTDQLNDLRLPERTRHALSGIVFFEIDSEDYDQVVQDNLRLLSEVCAGWFHVFEDDSLATTVRVMPGRARLNGATLVYAGGTKALAAFNNDVAYVYLEDDGAGAAQITAVADGTGWPATPHLKLAEVTLSAGAIVLPIVDRTQEYKLGLAGSEAVRYAMAITTQGSTAGASTITITLKDVGGNMIAAVDYLRVRICNSGAYAVATNATIAAGANTTAVEVMTTDKDLVLKSHTDGTFKVTLTDGTAETVTLRIGPATLTARRGDTTNTLNVTHA